MSGYHSEKDFVARTKLVEAQGRVASSQNKTAQWQAEARRLQSELAEKSKAFDLYAHDATIIADLLRGKVTTLTDAIADALLAGNFEGPRMEAVEDALTAALAEVTP